LEKVRALEDEVFNDKHILNVRQPGRPKKKQEIIIPPTTNKKTRVVLNIKPVLKLQEKLKKQLEKVRALEDEVFNDKRILNVRPPGRPKKQLEEIKPLHVKYDSKKVESKTVIQYLSK